MAARWSAALKDELPAAIAVRHELHRHPRISGEEHPTAVVLAEALGVELRVAAQTGRVGRLGPVSGPAIGVRAELDALPVSERTGVAYSSTGGAMHACGHDVHMAALVALVRSARRMSLPFALAPVLQPREETYPSGALDMVEEGVLKDLEIVRMIGAHVHPGVPAGRVAIGAGAINAAADEIEIVLTGIGGHGGYPHHATDPVTALAHLILGLPDVVRRTISALEPAAVSVGTVTAGDGAANVLPASARLKATMRTTAPASRERLRRAIERYAQHQAEAFGCQADLHYTAGEPALINDDELATGAQRWLSELGGWVAEPLRSLGADDFAFFSEQVPSLMLFVGVEAACDPAPSLHDPRFLPPDAAVGDVAQAMLAGWLAAAQALGDTA